MNQCKNVAKFQKDNFKKLSTGHWISILNRKEMLRMNSGNLPGCQKFDISYWYYGEIFKRTANYAILLPKLDPFHSKGKLPSHSRKSLLLANSVPRTLQRIAERDVYTTPGILDTRTLKYLSEKFKKITNILGFVELSSGSALL